MKIITMDCGQLKSAPEFHDALAVAMEFPDYYGKNLDALFDCLTDIHQEQELVLLNWHPFSYAVKDYAEKLMYVFRCACQENTRLTVTLHP